MRRAAAAAAGRGARVRVSRPGTCRVSSAQGPRPRYRASATISRCRPCSDRRVRPLRLARSARRRSLRPWRSLARCWARWPRRMIAQARVAGRRVRLSLLSSTTTLAPKVAYSSSRRTQAANSCSGRSRAGSSRRLSATKAASSPRGPTGVAGRGAGPGHGGARHSAVPDQGKTVLRAAQDASQPANGRAAALRRPRAPSPSHSTGEPKQPGLHRTHRRTAAGPELSGALLGPGHQGSWP